MYFNSNQWLLRSSGEDGGVGRNVSLLHTTKRRTTTNLNIRNNQNCQKIKLHGTLTTKELKKHLSTLVGGAETDNCVERMHSKMMRAEQVRRGLVDWAAPHSHADEVGGTTRE